MNSPDHPAAMTARQVITALVGAGVRDVVIAPGSRSAPLAYALHAAQGAGLLQAVVRADERSAGFVALGIARHRPAAVVTTSGTAVANLHPAVLEASHSMLPLIVISADRPHELRGVGANQTTDQARLFGNAVRWQGEIPAARTPATAGAGVSQAVLRAVSAATGARTDNPGPVHLNVAFAPPLTPADAWEPPRVSAHGVIPKAPTREAMPTLLRRGPRTIIVAGDDAGPAAATFADAAGWPVLAEPTSGLRGHRHAVAAPQVLAELLGGQVQRVVVFGRPTLSRQVTALLSRDEVEMVVIARGPQWVDVAGTADLVTDAVVVLDDPEPEERDWLQTWTQASEQARRALDEAFAGQSLCGPVVANRVLGAHAAAMPVLLGASMAVRDADLAAGCGEHFTSAPVLANRGLSGIDGTISTASGIALATGGPVRAIMGDLTFQHDVGGLAVGPLEKAVDLQVIVLNDDGGSIFATLEHGQSEYAEVYPRMFQTPQGIAIAELASGFGARYRALEDAQDLHEALQTPPRGREVLEVRLDSDTARERWLDLYAHVRAAVSGSA